MTVPAGGAYMRLVSVEKPYEGLGKYVGPAVLGSVAGRHIKQATIVDADIHPFDPIQTEWAASTPAQANRYIEILKQLTGIILDLSLPRKSSGRPCEPRKSSSTRPATMPRFSADLFAGKRSDGQSGKGMGALRHSTGR